MKCKPGDRAIVIKGKYAGKVVEVLYESPPEDFTLPDGSENWGAPPGFWVVKSLGTPFLADVGTSAGFSIFPLKIRESLYLSIADAILQPLREEPDADDRVTDKAVSA